MRTCASFHCSFRCTAKSFPPQEATTVVISRCEAWHETPGTEEQQARRAGGAALGVTCEHPDHLSWKGWRPLSAGQLLTQHWCSRTPPGTDANKHVLPRLRLSPLPSAHVAPHAHLANVSEPFPCLGSEAEVGHPTPPRVSPLEAGAPAREPNHETGGQKGHEPGEGCATAHDGADIWKCFSSTGFMHTCASIVPLMRTCASLRDPRVSAGCVSGGSVAPGRCAAPVGTLVEVNPP